MWQTAPSPARYILSTAQAYCAGLTLGGYHDWRVPDIDALRSLIRGCPATMTGGSCGVTDQCLKSSCYTSSCGGCAQDAGPANGCYWPSQIDGVCVVDGSYVTFLSATTVVESTGIVIPVDVLFAQAALGVDTEGYLICVRS
jgi:hypothetical protein